jgi:hypothetical protein
MEKYDYIKWPITLTEHYSEKFGKHIYIFGDMHMNKIHCPPDERLKKSIDVIDFFARLPNLERDGEPLLIDYFFELPYKDKLYNREKSSRDSALNKININFYKCLQREKGDCQYKNVRMHYIDVRTIDVINDIMNLLLYNSYLKVIIQIFIRVKFELKLPELLIQEMEYFGINININNINYKQIMKDILSRYKRIDWKKIENLTELNSDKILDLLKINKQFDNIEYPQIYAHFKTFFLDKLEIFFKTALDKDHIQFLKQSISMSIDDMSKNSKKIMEFEQDLLGNNVLLDIYLTSRIFRAFKDAESPKNIIVYVGDEHADMLRKFLKLPMNDFKEINSTRSDNITKDMHMQCINISKFEQPFFQPKKEDKEYTDVFIKSFKMFPTQENFNRFSKYIKGLFKKYAKYAVDNNKGNVKLAKLVLTFE